MFCNFNKLVYSNERQWLISAINISDSLYSTCCTLLKGIYLRLKCEGWHNLLWNAGGRVRIAISIPKTSLRHLFEASDSVQEVFHMHRIFVGIFKTMTALSLQFREKVALIKPILRTNKVRKFSYKVSCIQCNEQYQGLDQVPVAMFFLVSRLLALNKLTDLLRLQQLSCCVHFL